MAESYWDSIVGALKPFLGGEKVRPPQPSEANAQNPTGSVIPWNPDMTPSKGVPGPEILASLPMAHFAKLREQFPSQSDQNFIAPFEHRAYVREFGRNLPEKLILGAALPLGYNLGKSMGVVHGRSQPSFQEWNQALRGAFDSTPK